jgi:uncharacterized protein YuzE
MTVAQSAKPSSRDITVTLKRLIALLEEDETDEYGILQPTQFAFKLAMRLVVEAYEVMGDSFPRASASTDEQGGIRLTWRKMMKVKYDPEADILIFILRDRPPVNAIAEPGGVIVSYDDAEEPISIEFLNASKRQLFNPKETNFTIYT